MNSKLFYRYKTYDIAKGTTIVKLMPCEIVEHSVTSKIKIRLTGHLWKGQPNAVISVLKSNIQGYIDPNKHIEIKQYKD
jgi:hypothetical protein